MKVTEQTQTYQKVGSVYSKSEVWFFSLDYPAFLSRCIFNHKPQDIHFFAESVIL